MPTKKSILSIILVLCLSLVLLLTACSSGGSDSPSDTTTPGVSDTQTPDNTPSGTETPSNTPGVNDTTSVATKEQDNSPSKTEPPFDLTKYPKPIWATDYDDETVADRDKEINEDCGWSEYGGIDAVIEETYQKYGKYIHEYLTKDVVRDAIKMPFLIDWIEQIPTKNDNPAHVTPAAFEKASDFLIAHGEEALTDINDPYQSIAALWIVINLNYNLGIASWWSDIFIGDFPGDPYVRDLKSAMDLSMAVALAKCSDTTNLLDGEVQNYMDWFIATYRSMFPSLRPR